MINLKPNEYRIDTIRIYHPSGKKVWIYSTEVSGHRYVRLARGTYDSIAEPGVKIEKEFWVSDGDHERMVSCCEITPAELAYMEQQIGR